MASKIAPLHAHLAALRRQRWTLRVVRGGMALAGLLLAALAVDFLADWLVSFSRVQRALLLGVMALLAAWGLRRLIWPALVSRESDIDLALLVERQQGIDSDLVAALQFEGPAARSWGSAELEDAVVDYVAEFGNDLQVKRGLAGANFRRAALVVGAPLVAFALAALFLPYQLASLLNRLVLGSAHYPTQTTIERIAVNGQEIDLARPAKTPIRVAHGAAVRFEVQCSGIAPETGEVRIATS